MSTTSSSLAITENSFSSAQVATAECCNRFAQKCCEVTSGATRIGVKIAVSNPVPRVILSVVKSVVKSKPTCRLVITVKKVNITVTYRVVGIVVQLDSLRGLPSQGIILLALQ